MLNLLLSLFDVFADEGESLVEIGENAIDPDLVEPIDPGASPGSAAEVRFGWAYPETASADELILSQDGSGYRYPSDFVAGTNPYVPE